jgi:DUF3089 family protein
MRIPWTKALWFSGIWLTFIFQIKIMKKSQTQFIVLLGLVFCFFISCKKSTEEVAQTAKYKNTSNWAYLDSDPQKTVDVFFVYPTIFDGTEPSNMNIDDPLLREKAKLATRNQSGVFTHECNLFAPFYQQMSMQCLLLADQEKEKYFEIAYADVKKAFQYYLENLNQGRPFIIAGHSQGSEILIQIMKDEFSDEQLMEQLIAAYLIGYSVTEFDLYNSQWMKMAQNAFDNGVIVSYNTQSYDISGSPVLLPGARCTNPLSWKTSNDYAEKEENLGAVFFDAVGNIESVIPQFTGAWIDENGALVAFTLDPANYYTPPFPMGVYHKFDYSFFYRNLQKNVSDRVVAYWE